MQEELTYNERKEWARLLYTRHDKNIKDISLTVSVEEAIVRKWVWDEEWEGVKRSLLISKTSQLENLYAILEKLSNKVKDDKEVNTKEADLIVKYTTAIKNLETETTVSTIIEVADLFVRWLHKKDLELTKIVTVQFNTFIKQRIAAGKRLNN